MWRRRCRAYTTRTCIVFVVAGCRGRKVNRNASVWMVDELNQRKKNGKITYESDTACVETNRAILLLSIKHLDAVLALTVLCSSVFLYTLYPQPIHSFDTYIPRVYPKPFICSIYVFFSLSSAISKNRNVLIDERKRLADDHIIQNAADWFTVFEIRLLYIYSYDLRIHTCMASWRNKNYLK